MLGMFIVLMETMSGTRVVYELHMHYNKHLLSQNYIMVFLMLDFL